MSDISRATLWNLVRLTRIEKVKLVKKNNLSKYIKNEFVDDRYPELSWRLIYKRVHKGLFRDKFVISDILIKDSRTDEILFKLVDDIRNFDINVNIDWHKTIDSKDVKSKSDYLYNVMSDLIWVE